MDKYEVIYVFRAGDGRKDTYKTVVKEEQNKVKVSVGGIKKKYGNCTCWEKGKRTDRVRKGGNKMQGEEGSLAEEMGRERVFVVVKYFYPFSTLPCLPSGLVEEPYPFTASGVTYPPSLLQHHCSPLPYPH